MAAVVASMGAAASAQQRYYVNGTATGDGTGSSWVDAFADLQSALQAAGDGDEIWVAAGVYYPGPLTASRGTSFNIPGGVSVIGGFLGHESEIDQRTQHFLFRTVLSGDLGRDDDTPAVCQFIGDCIPNGGNVLCAGGMCPGLPNNSENTFHVVRINGGGGTRLDSLVIEGGAANSWLLGEVDGGGVFLGTGYVVISGCTMRDNFAYRNGGGFYVGSGQAVFEACFFVNNEAAHSSAGRGGGLFNSSGDVTLRRCYFVGNSVGHSSTFMSGGEVGRGGGFHHGNGIASIEECVFVENRSYRQGGAIFQGGGFLKASASLFFRNWADNIGGGAVWSSGRGEYVSCLFAENRSETVGGAAVLFASTMFDQCIFEGNKSELSGGAAYLAAAAVDVEIAECQFERNVSGSSGGALYTDGDSASLTIRQSVFAENFGVRGGAVFNQRPRMRVERTRLAANEALEAGGAIDNRGAGTNVENCVFDANRAYRGGAVHTTGGGSLVGNVLAGNVAQEGSMIFGNGGKLLLNSSILIGSANDQSSDSNIVGTVGTSVRYCCFDEGMSPMAGEGNFAADPRLRSVPGADGDFFAWRDNDYRLQLDSPCIDAGDPAIVEMGAELDWDGDDRMAGCRMDVGADESISLEIKGDFSGDGMVNLRDASAFLLCFDEPAAGGRWSDTCLCSFDFDGSGDVGIRDWSSMKARFENPR